MRSIVWPGDPRITQPYGKTDETEEPLLDGVHFHCGIDVGLVVETPLSAAEDSVVAYVGTALLALVGRVCWWYVHIDRVAPGVFVGKRLARGELACYSGNKVPAGGASTGPHLHLEAQKATKAILGSYDGNGRFVEPAGALNNPATSTDPLALLALRFSTDEASIAAAIRRRRTSIVATTKSLHEFCRGGGPAFDLYHRRRVNGSWSAWTSLGGNLAASGITAGVDDKGAIIVTVEGYKDGAPNGLFYDIVSADDGVTWSAWAANGAGGDSMAMLAVLAASPAAAASVDLSPVLSSIADLKAAVGNIKVTGGGLTPEQDAHLGSIEAAVEQLEGQLTTGLKITGTAAA